MNRIAAFPIIIFFFVLSILLFDIGNPNAPRQGTEGFYLKVSKDTFQHGNFLTPIHTKSPHWSKPPLLFVLPFPLYLITSAGDLWSARVSILLLSVLALIALTFIVTNLTKRFEFKTEFFLYFLTSLAFLKYSRIFMNEAILLLLPLLSNLLLYKYLFSSETIKKNRTLCFSVLIAILSSYSKGPVSVVGQIIPTTLFLLMNERSKFMEYLKKFIIPVSLLSMLWIFYEWYLYGNEFYEYFFLRENLGKFTSKKYPLFVVLAGAFIFSLPWSLYLFNIKGAFNLVRRKCTQITEDHLCHYLVFHAIFLIIFWTLPSQRSHHYGIPAAGHILLILYIYFIKSKFSIKPLLIMSVTFSFMLLLILVCLFSLNMTTVNSLLILLIIFTVTTFLYKKLDTFISKISILFFALFSQIWLILGPAVYLPILPDKVVTILEHQPTIFASYRKPFYLEEILQKPVISIDPSVITKTLENNSSGIFITTKEHLLNVDPNLFEIIEVWPTWARGVSFSRAWNALRLKNFSEIQEVMLLVKVRQAP